MLNKKMALILVAIIAIGIFALPSTVAMFGGQHNWYDLSPEGNQVPCEKCHADIAGEMSVTGAHRNLSCEHCHRTDGAVGSYAGDWDGSVNPGTGAHAASTEDCMICHDGEYGDTNFTHYNIPSTPNNENCVKCHPAYFGSGDIYPPTAGGFGISSDPDDNGTYAAHLAFILDSKDDNSTLMVGTNEACIACHTHVAIDINWTHRYKMSLDADGSSGGWLVDNFLTEGTYNVTTYGNMSGGTTGSTDPEIEIIPGPEGFDPENP
ncbi:MAG: hypothetical protein SVY15_03965 [Halobacteriota archaeon]|nr:hypothetical protein [Halobacteriota archaeon]